MIPVHDLWSWYIGAKLADIAGTINNFKIIILGDTYDKTWLVNALKAVVYCAASLSVSRLGGICGILIFGALV